MNKYQVAIGLEIHLELNTKTKMFSPAPIIYNALPNSAVHEIDLGYPGTLPSVNKQAVIKGIKLAKALNMEIDNLLRFDRKNYFYPDLPKGFQITQQFYPLGKNGVLNLKNGTKILIERLHLEEDTAKSIHKNQETFLDYNRAGIPLLEIVTKPCFTNSQDVAEYINLIRILAIKLNISDAKMEQGSMRVDINISLQKLGIKTLGTKVEIKNLNSINNAIRAIEYEIQNQTNLLNQNLVIFQTTKRFDEKSMTNILMRDKTNIIDYKYFPEPNILPIKLSEDFLNKIIIPELPWDQRIRYQKANISDEYIEQLINDQEKNQFFDQIDFPDKNLWSKIFFSEIVSLSNSQQKSITDLNLNPKQLTKLLTLLVNKKISSKQLKEILPQLINQNFEIDNIFKNLEFKQITNHQQLNEIIKEIIKEHKSFIEVNKMRPSRVLKFVLGKVMQVTKGAANPQIASELLKKQLEL